MGLLLLNDLLAEILQQIFNVLLHSPHLLTSNFFRFGAPLQLQKGKVGFCLLQVLSCVVLRAKTSFISATARYRRNSVVKCSSVTVENTGQVAKVIERIVLGRGVPLRSLSVVCGWKAVVDV